VELEAEQRGGDVGRRGPDVVEQGREKVCRCECRREEVREGEARDGDAWGALALVFPVFLFAWFL
jgi:hypothetical protein